MSTLHKHLNKTITPTQKITDVKDANLFGIHLTTQKSLDSFQEKSGMKGHYTTEYQHHYWAAVGRMQLENQTLDVCIPLALFNYPQKCSSGSVAFDLREVSAVSAQLAELADAKMKEFMSVCGQKMTDALGLQWMYADQMTLHVHPGRMSTFSGTDYCKTINDPGVVYPLNAGENVPSFSSIMCHTGSKAELIRTEYRMFNGTADGDKNYRQGKCISYVRREEKLNGPITAMFIGNETTEKSYVFKDGFVREQGDDLLKMLTDIFNESNFEPSTDFIIEKNVTKQGYGKKPTVHSYWGNNKVQVSTPGKQQSLFLGEEAEPEGTVTLRNGEDLDLSDYTQFELNQMRDFIVFEGEFLFQQAKVMEDSEVLFFYIETVNEMNTADRKDIPVQIVEEPEVSETTIDGTKLDGTAFSESIIALDGINSAAYNDAAQTLVKQYNFMIAADFSESEILALSDQEVEYILETLGFDEDE